MSRGIDEYSGERVEYVAERRGRRFSAIVKAQIVTKSRDHRTDRVARQPAGRSLAHYDVLIENVSLVGNYRVPVRLGSSRTSSYDELVAPAQEAGGAAQATSRARPRSRPGRGTR